MAHKELIPDSLGPYINQSLEDNNGETTAFLLVTVLHGQPIQTVTNMDDEMQVHVMESLIETVKRDAMTKSTLLNPEGSA